MKKTIRTSRASGELERIFRICNKELFNNEIPEPIITIQSGKGRSYGHSTTKKIWNNRNGEKPQYELNIACEFLNTEIECVLDTMIHEMIHLYCREKDIKETSRGNIYHNKEFKKLAEQCHLITTYDKRCGYNTDHTGNEFLTQFAIDHDIYEIEIGTNPISALVGNMGTSGATGTTETPGTTSSTIKYKCPKCGLKIRATKDVDGQIKHEPCNALFERF